MTTYSPNAYHRALQVLERLNEPDLLETYRQFVARLDAILTPEEQDTYAAFQQRTTGGARPEEQAVADKVAADSEAPALYERYLSLLGSRELHDSEVPGQHRAKQY
jgi:hypothetical protein